MATCKVAFTRCTLGDQMEVLTATDVSRTVTDVFLPPPPPSRSVNRCGCKAAVTTHHALCRLHQVTAAEVVPVPVTACDAHQLPCRPWGL